MKNERPNKTNPIKEFFEFVIDYSKANIRNRRLMAAERIAIRLTGGTLHTNRANSIAGDRRTRWIVRWRQNKYIVFTKYEVDDLKKKGILAESVDMMKLSEVADSCVAWDSSKKCAYIVGKRGK